MNGSVYQKKVIKRTLVKKPGFKPTDEQNMIVWNALGLAGEAGEVVDLIKKGVFHQHGIDQEKLKYELGDVLWYVAALCENLGIDLGDVMEANNKKLEKRYPKGFTVINSRYRPEVDTG